MANELYVEKNNHIATIVFNRPEKKNAFNLAMFNQLEEILD